MDRDHYNFLIQKKDKKNCNNKSVTKKNKLSQNDRWVVIFKSNKEFLYILKRYKSITYQQEFVIFYHNERERRKKEVKCTFNEAEIHSSDIRLIHQFQSFWHFEVNKTEIYTWFVLFML